MKKGDVIRQKCVNTTFYLTGILAHKVNNSNLDIVIVVIERLDHMYNPKNLKNRSIATDYTSNCSGKAMICDAITHPEKNDDNDHEFANLNHLITEFAVLLRVDFSALVLHTGFTRNCTVCLLLLCGCIHCTIHCVYYGGFCI